MAEQPLLRRRNLVTVVRTGRVERQELIHHRAQLVIYQADVVRRRIVVPQARDHGRGVGNRRAPAVALDVDQVGFLAPGVAPTGSDFNVGDAQYVLPLLGHNLGRAQIVGRLTAAGDADLGQIFRPTVLGSGQLLLRQLRIIAEVGPVVGHKAGQLRREVRLHDAVIARSLIRCGDRQVPVHRMQQCPPHVDVIQRRLGRVQCEVEIGGVGNEHEKVRIFGPQRLANVREPVGNVGLPVLPHQVGDVFVVGPLGNDAFNVRLLVAPPAGILHDLIFTLVLVPDVDLEGAVHACLGIGRKLIGIDVLHLDEAGVVMRHAHDENRARRRQRNLQRLVIQRSQAGNRIGLAVNHRLRALDHAQPQVGPAADAVGADRPRPVVYRFLGYDGRTV